ncbi:MAG: hypothetical protein COB46_03840 [Rhodospirillaceae bacterium]|nr:MAG: hypothetical protein COB46_03840 [Rhodospirillaceae bacterium]
MQFSDLIQAVKQNPEGFKAFKNNAVRLMGVLGVSVLVSACATVTQSSKSDAYTEGCMAERADIVDAMDWDAVQPNHMTIVNGEIRPMVLYLEENRPYQIQIRNADRIDHDLWSPEFFKQGAAVQSVQFGAKTPTKGCINGVRIKGRSVVTIRLVPVWEGRYELFNSTSFLRTPLGADAVVHIVQPRIGIASK